MSDLDYPLHCDRRGRTATADAVDHVRDMIEQVLFTSPGERVNRPDFGSGLLRLVFEPNAAELATALTFTIKAALHRWLDDIIEIRGVDVVADGAKLTVQVQYLIRRTGDVRIDTFPQAAPS